MKHSHARRLGAILALGATAAVLLAAAAAGSGGHVIRESIHDEGTLVLNDFCDVQGLTVELAFTLDLRLHAVPHGPDGLVYFLSHGTETDVFTNLANGNSVTGVLNVVERDQRITNNGDNTLTILVLATGNAVLYGEDGRAIARNPGQVRFEILIDDGGTPNDPSDDEFLSNLGLVKGSTGRTDDFCAAAVPALS